MEVIRTVLWLFSFAAVHSCQTEQWPLGIRRQVRLEETPMWYESKTKVTIDPCTCRWPCPLWRLMVLHSLAGSSFWKSHPIATRSNKEILSPPSLLVFVGDQICWWMRRGRQREGGECREGWGEGPSVTERARSKSFCCEGVMRLIDGRCHRPLL